MFSIEADFTAQFVVDMVQKQVDAWLHSLLEDYRRAGLAFVERMRDRTAPDFFNNITWNLRSSIGYLLLYNGEVVESYFPALQSGELGAVTGDAYAREISASSDYDHGVCLIIVAGMEYASFVESKDKDVISFASTSFPEDLLEQFKK